MKKADKLISELISKILEDYIFEAEEKAADDKGGGNPFAAAGAEGGDAAGGEEAPADDAAADDKEEGGDKKPAAPAGLEFKFDVSAAKKYNTASFRSDSAVAKKITKNGILATVQPDGVDVLIGFDDITESAKDFFKNKK